MDTTASSFIEQGINSATGKSQFPKQQTNKQRQNSGVANVTNAP